MDDLRHEVNHWSLGSDKKVSISLTQLHPISRTQSSSTPALDRSTTLSCSSYPRLLCATCCLVRYVCQLLNYLEQLSESMFQRTKALHNDLDSVLFQAKCCQLDLSNTFKPAPHAVQHSVHREQSVRRR